MANIKYQAELIRKDDWSVVELEMQGVSYDITEEFLAGKMVDVLEDALSKGRNFVRFGNAIIPIDLHNLPEIRVTITSKEA